MPVRVVDALEVVDVADDHAHRLAGDLRLLLELLDALGEGLSVQQPGQRVMRRGVSSGAQFAAQLGGPGNGA